jgi:GTPase SAR1 family protein
MPPTIPLLLVGTKNDECIPVMQETHHHQQQMVDLMKEIGALGYVECSALTQREELKNVFDQAIRFCL